MLPFRHSSLFRNRWFALIWAAGICWSAVSFVGSSSAPEAGEGVDAGNSAADAADAANIDELQALVGRLEP